MLLKTQHETNTSEISRRISALYKDALRQKNLTRKSMAELAGYTKIDRGINRINRVMDSGEVSKQEGDLPYKVCQMLEVKEPLSELAQELEAESARYNSALSKEKELLRTHLTSIVAHSDLIQADEEMRYALISEYALAGGMYIGGGYLPLGLLLDFWKQDQFTEICSACDSKVYLYSAGGSPLSGSGSMGGTCIECSDESKFAFNAGLVISSKKHELFKSFQKRVSEGHFMRIEELVDRLGLANSQELEK